MDEMKVDYENFRIRTFNMLTTKELYEILRVRCDVFVKEEGIFYPDVDGIDYDSVHIFSVNQDGLVTSYLRMFFKLDEDNVMQLGRVLTRVHGIGMGSELLQLSLKVAGSMDVGEVYVESQEHAKNFYLKNGFRIVSDVFIEAGIPHIKMRKLL